MRAVEGEHRQAELLLEDPLRRGDRRFSDHAVGRGKHPTFAVHLRAFLVEGPDVVPWTRGIQVAHQDLRGTASPADHEERREAEPALRDLARRHRPIDGGEPGELSLRCHAGTNPLPTINLADGPEAVASPRLMVGSGLVPAWQRSESSPGSP